MFNQLTIISFKFIGFTICDLAKNKSVIYFKISKPSFLSFITALLFNFKIIYCSHNIKFQIPNFKLI
ncbi:hypothetical protein ASG31_03475 [Chryseobacterium sp. Leaf404]|nr:hypothetical protein ASG31_03475 [Chryseobacterium sp. Leaf404]